MLRRRIVRRRLLWGLAVAFGIAMPVSISYSLAQYPRRVLLSDLKQANKVIVGWILPEGYRSYRIVAFELSDPQESQLFGQLKKNLGVDYFRTTATVTPSIGIYMLNSENEVAACYWVRFARGGGSCPSMRSIRNIAEKGRPLSDIEATSLIENPHHRSKWPKILPAHYDFVLPVTGTGDSPLRDELEIQTRTDLGS